MDLLWLEDIVFADQSVVPASRAGLSFLQQLLGFVQLFVDVSLDLERDNSHQLRNHAGMIDNILAHSYVHSFILHFFI